jgi:Actin
MRIMPGGALESEQEGPSSIFVGNKLVEHRGAFLLEYPMEKGYVVDGRWDLMEKIWDVSFLIYCLPGRKSFFSNIPFTLDCYSVHIYKLKCTD